MATKPSWVTLNKESGSGPGSFTITAEPHYGREDRTGKVTVKGVGVTEDQIINLTQFGKERFVQLVDKDGNELSGNIQIPKSGTSLKEIFVKSNVDGLKVEWYLNRETNTTTWNESGKGYDINDESKTPYPDASFDETYYVGSTALLNNVTFTSGNASSNQTAKELGKQSAYIAKFTIQVPENTDNEKLTRKLWFSGAQTEYSVLLEVTIEQTAGQATLSVRPTSLEFVAAGETKTVNVTSNTRWDIS